MRLGLQTGVERPRMRLAGRILILALLDIGFVSLLLIGRRLEADRDRAQHRCRLQWLRRDLHLRRRRRLLVVSHVEPASRSLIGWDTGEAEHLGKVLGDGLVAGGERAEDVGATAGSASTLRTPTHA